MVKCDPDQNSLSSSSTIWFFFVYNHMPIDDCKRGLGSAREATTYVSLEWPPCYSRSRFVPKHCDMSSFDPLFMEKNIFVFGLYFYRKYRVFTLFFVNLLSFYLEYLRQWPTNSNSSPNTSLQAVFHLRIWKQKHSDRFKLNNVRKILYL